MGINQDVKKLVPRHVENDWYTPYISLPQWSPHATQLWEVHYVMKRSHSECHYMPECAEAAIFRHFMAECLL